MKGIIQNGFYKQISQLKEMNLYKAVKLGEKIFEGLSIIYLIFSMTLKLSVLITIGSFAVYLILYYLRNDFLYLEYKYEFTNGNPSKFKCDVYVAVLKSGSINAQIEMIPDGELLNLCFRRAPRVVKIDN